MHRVAPSPDPNEELSSQKCHIWMRLRRSTMNHFSSVTVQIPTVSGYVYHRTLKRLREVEKKKKKQELDKEILVNWRKPFYFICSVLNSVPLILLPKLKFNKHHFIEYIRKTKRKIPDKHCHTS